MGNIFRLVETGDQATITEDYVSFEIAKLLKEKGLKVDPETCRRWAVNKQLYDEGHFNVSNATGDYIPIPTIQLAMKWLREIHHIYINIIAYYDSSLYYTIDIWRLANGKPEYLGGTDIDELDLTDWPVSYSYEEACETAIRFCLNKVI